MAIKFKIIQNKNRQSETYGKYYGRIVNNGTISTEQLSSMIQENVSAKESDVYAVLKELKNAVHAAFADGHGVRIDGLGTFRPSFKSDGVEDPKKFTADNIRRGRVLFQPETQSRKVDLTRIIGEESVRIKTRVRDVKLMMGVQYVEDGDYTSPKNADATAPTPVNP